MAIAMVMTRCKVVSRGGNWDGMEMGDGMAMAMSDRFGYKWAMGWLA